MKNKTYLKLLFIVPILLFVVRKILTGSDIWFMASTGKYILNNGFPYIDPLTVHEGLSLVVPQWITCVILYVIFSKFQYMGLAIFEIIMLIVLEYILYKLCLFVSNKNYKVSIIVSSLISFLLVLLKFIDARPQLFTYVNILLFTIIIEYYMKNNKKKVLLLLPLISILQVNVHASMWWFLFVFALPFIAEMLWQKYVKKEKLKYSINLLVQVLIISFFCGLINPYGIDSINYMFLGQDENIGKIITEMVKLDAFSIHYLTIILILFINFIVIMIYYSKYKKVRVSYILFLFGSLILAQYSKKSSVFMLIFGLYPMAYYFMNYKIDLKVKFSNKIYYSIIVVCLLICVYCLSKNVYIGKFLTYNNVINDYVIKNNDVSKLKIYANYEVGGYFEYLGAKSYIDTRAEHFLKKMNKKEDIFEEYINLQYGILDYKKFIEKYDFSYIVITDNDYLFYVKNIDGYEKIYDDSYLKIYVNDNVKNIDI